MQFFRFSLAFALFASAGLASLGRSQEMVVFGDSLSDTGNFSLASGGSFPPPSLYFQGRFANGPIWTDRFGPSIGMQPPVASLAGGKNFAFNGSRALGPSPYGTPDLPTQVGLYLLQQNGTLNPKDLFVLWIGSNDIYFGAASGEPYAVENALWSIDQSVRSLHQAGARKFVVLNLPPLGDTPYFDGTGQIADQLDWAAFQFDVGLFFSLWFAEVELRNIEIAQVDVFTLFQTVKRNPRRFQLNNTDIACTVFDPNSGLSVGFAPRPGTDPERSLFWDGVHPTSRAHEVVALRAMQIARMQLSPLLR